MKIITLLALVCITLTSCDAPQEDPSVLDGPTSSAENTVSHSNSKPAAVSSKNEAEDVLLSTSDMKKELSEYEKVIDLGINSDDAVNNKDIASILAKSVEFWDEKDWEIFRTQFDFNNTNNVEKFSRIVSGLWKLADKESKKTKEYIINNLLQIADNISDPSLFNTIMSHCGQMYYHMKDYDKAILMSDRLYNNCLENMDYKSAGHSVMLKMMVSQQIDKSEELDLAIENWDKDFPEADINDSCFIKSTCIDGYFYFPYNRKVNNIKGMKMIVSLLEDNRLNENNKNEVKTLYDKYKAATGCAEYLKSINYEIK